MLRKGCSGVLRTGMRIILGRTVALTTLHEMGTARAANIEISTSQSIISEDLSIHVSHQGALTRVAIAFRWSISLQSIDKNTQQT